MQKLIPILAFLLVAPFTAISSNAIEALHEEAYGLLDDAPDRAMQLADEALRLAERANDNYLQGQSLFIKAYLYRQKDDMGKAFVINLEALEVFKRSSEPKALESRVKVLLNTGEILKKHHVYAQAIKYYNEGIALAKNEDWKRRLVKLHYNKASALHDFGNLEEALEEVDIAKGIAEELNDELRIIRCLNQRGLILKDMKAYDAARTSFQEIINYPFSEISGDVHIGRAWHNIGVTYSDEGRLSGARLAYEEALPWRTDDRSLFLTYADLSRVYMDLKLTARAQETAALALPLYEKQTLLPENYEFFNTYSQIAFLTGDMAGSHEYSQRYIAENRKFLMLQEEILQVKDQYKMEVLAAGFFTEQQANKTRSQLQNYLWLSVLFFTLIIIFGKIKQRLNRYQLKKQILKIHEDSSV
ncbi:tetratricopeptide repeat protein [Marinoscillum furvescens]|uniref:Tetratricopeptide repeat protein n=1 Tax=Marinoscillum furvescens DSM 4134 TaxID=1122208 RepID=A0A3D9KZ16_MARFU|nr:hypothetical protein [Marinoscillum furvescens]RED92828.1 tetratricopeptide repeat protein [Marinoscillum furvescens DSM 4134]